MYPHFEFEMCMCQRDMYIMCLHYPSHTGSTDSMIQVSLLHIELPCTCTQDITGTKLKVNIWGLLHSPGGLWTGQRWSWCTRGSTVPAESPRWYMSHAELAAAPPRSERGHAGWRYSGTWQEWAASWSVCVWVREELNILCMHMYPKCALRTIYTSGKRYTCTNAFWC